MKTYIKEIFKTNNIPKPSYRINPKMDKSGVYAAIPQTGKCPNDCKECFFNSKRSYVQPFKDNLPNLPPIEKMKNKVVRINDGHDSNIQRKLVMETAKDYPMKFYNTAIAHDLEKFDAPVVLTINPGQLTDIGFKKLEKIPINLMFVRIRTNVWNLDSVVKPAIEYYTKLNVPVVLTFMAYHEEVDEQYYDDYVLRGRTTNIYHAITTQTWEEIMRMFKYNKYVHSCGKIEGEKGNTHCMYCGNCVREFFVTQDRMDNYLK